MDVARPTFFGKGRALSTVARNTSCSKGWLRLLVQSIFATITVASFILILMMAVKNPNLSNDKPPGIQAPPRCLTHNCRVVCQNTPHYHKYEEDVIFAVTEANSVCAHVFLDLQRPYFVNNTLPENWLSKMRSDVYKLAIVGGNLMHISSDAFMSQFAGNINLLILMNVEIKTWESTSLVGLSSLKNLHIISSHLEGIHENAIRPVDDTLETLTITGSGQWDPINLTGFKGLEKLTTVDFSYNNFNQILNRYTFVGLEVTKLLYLNSCRITAIGPGTFDHLTSIEVLYLNNNMLFSVPSGLFKPIAALEITRPRIHLQDNYWYCDCSVDDLRELVRNEILAVEAKCTYPDEMYSKTFTQFENICNNNGTASDLYVITDYYNFSLIEDNGFYPDPIYVNGSYCSSRTSHNLVELISPVRNNVCSRKNFLRFNVTELVDRDFIHETKDRNDWFEFSYFLITNLYSIVQIGASSKQRNRGIIWYQSKCPHEIYCLDTVPTFLRVYNADPNARYTFCPINVNDSVVETEKCVDFTVVEKIPSKSNETSFQAMLLISTALVCSCFGALVVYGLIRRKPTLLKGSKRIVFVKHKNVDALVLPPKIPLRNDLNDVISFEDKKIFTLTTSSKLKPTTMKRTKSLRSDKSGSVSYISAVQPTEAQLAEWRIKHHFNNDLTIRSRKSELSTLSWVDASYYLSLEDNERTYESLK